MTHYYLVGAIPKYSAHFGSPADAVNAGAALHIDDRLTSGMRELVQIMTSRAPGARPETAAFLDALADPEVCTLTRKKRPSGHIPGAISERTPGGGASTPRPSRLRTNLYGARIPSRYSTAIPTADGSAPATTAGATTATGSATAATPTPTTDAPESRPPDASPPRPTSRVRVNLGRRTG
jgi:eukaryotic-like serine/threonine-protein kinase